jgi:hypothetical protein
VLKCATEGVIAYYIHHQTVIQIVVFFIADWDMGKKQENVSNFYSR